MKDFRSIFVLLLFSASYSSQVVGSDYSGYFSPASEACIEYELGEGEALSLFTRVYEVDDHEVHLRDVVVHAGEVVSDAEYVLRHEDGGVYKYSDGQDVIVWPGAERAGDGWELYSHLHTDGADAEVRGECRLVDQEINSEEEPHDDLHILCQARHRGDTFGHRRVYRDGVGLVKEYSVLETSDGEAIERASMILKEIKTEFEACP